MTEPTDAEILSLNAGEIHFSESPTKYPEYGHGTQYHAGAPGILSFARAVLAKWGTPPAVAEPFGWLYEWTHSSATGRADETYTGFTKDEQHARKHDNCRAVYTAPQPAQAQAVAVPMYRLLQSGVDRIEAADEFLSDDTTTWAIDPNGIFVGNIYGGHVLRPARRRIKGGQHGAE